MTAAAYTSVPLYIEVQQQIADLQFAIDVLGPDTDEGRKRSDMVARLRGLLPKAYLSRVTGEGVQ
jgi:hypothetical protein